MIVGEGVNDGQRRVFAFRQRFRQRQADGGRRIVEERRHGERRGIAMVGREIGVKIGSRQGTCALGTAVGGRIAHPREKRLDHHTRPHAHIRNTHAGMLNEPARP